MDVEKVKLIVNNLESLLRLLKEELYTEKVDNSYSTTVPFNEDDIDEVFSE